MMANNKIYPTVIQVRENSIVEGEEGRVLGQFRTEQKMQDTNQIKEK